MDPLVSAIATGALLSGVVAIGVTVAIERFGGKVGGVLGSLPTTIVPASYGFLVVATSDDALRDALCGVPAGMLVNGLFLWMWRVLPGRLPVTGLWPRLLLMSVLSLGAWLIGATTLVLGMGALNARGVPVPVTGTVLAAVLVVAGIAACWNLPPAPKGKRPVPLAALLSRGLLAGLAVGVAIWLSKTQGPLIGGVASVFPAIFLTTMASLWVSQGEAVQSGAVGPILLGSSSVSAYALLAAITLPALGFAAGAPLAWLGAVLFASLPAMAFVTRRR